MVTVYSVVRTLAPETGRGCVTFRIRALSGGAASRAGDILKHAAEYVLGMHRSGPVPHKDIQALARKFLSA